MSTFTALPPLTACGWASTLQAFVETPSAQIVRHLIDFVPDCRPQQESVWRTYVKRLQAECHALITECTPAGSFHILLEYEIPRESRRPDVLILANGRAFVLELKSYSVARRAFIDQVFAYARDLGCYHRDLEGKRIVPLLVLTAAKFDPFWQDQVLMTPLDGVHAEILGQLDETGSGFDLPCFLDPGAYRPLPTLVRAASALFQHNPLPTIKRAAATTDPAVERISEMPTIRSAFTRAISHSAFPVKLMPNNPTPVGEANYLPVAGSVVGPGSSDFTTAIFS